MILKKMSLMLFLLAACIGFANYSSAKFIRSEFSRDGTKVVTISREYSKALAAVWDIKTGEKLSERAFSFDSKKATISLVDTKKVTVFYDGGWPDQIVIEDLITGEHIRFSASDNSEQNQIVVGEFEAFCYQGHDKIMFVKRFDDGKFSVEIWSTVTGKKLCELENPKAAGELLIYSGGMLSDNIFSFDGSKFVAFIEGGCDCDDDFSDDDDKIIVWDTHTGKKLSEKVIDNDDDDELLYGATIAFSASDKVVMANGSQASHLLWYGTDLMHDAKIGSVEHDSSFSRIYRFSADTSKIVTYCVDAEDEESCTEYFITWDTATGQKLHEITFTREGSCWDYWQQEDVPNLNLHGTILVMPNERKNKLTLYDAQTGKQLLELEDPMN